MQGNRKVKMGLLKRILIGTGITAAAAGVVIYFRRLSKAGKELEAAPRVNIHKLGLDGITLRVDARLKNPTRTSLKIKFPFIRILYKENSIGTSRLIDKDIVIPKYGEVVIEGIMINIPLFGLFSLGYDLYKALGSGEGIVVKVKTMTTIDLGFSKLPFSDEKEITLKKGKA